jgi:hypothetical protein
MPVYHLAVFGRPSPAQEKEIRTSIGDRVGELGLTVGKDVELSVNPAAFDPPAMECAAALFFGAPGAPLGIVAQLLTKAVAVIPIVSDITKAKQELPQELQLFNAVAYGAAGPARIASALLECAGLLPRQRRLFISYRRTESTVAALQLLEALCSRMFDVFLDTRGVAPGADFQSVLWQRLCESDVLVMLDTATYFDSRWTAAEFGRALAKGIGVLRVGWPGINASPRAATSARLDLSAADINATSGQLALDAIDRICEKVESVRSESVAVRRANLFGKIAEGIRIIGGSVNGMDAPAAMLLTLPDGRRVKAFAAVGVPTAESLYETSRLHPGSGTAVVYDNAGIERDWIAQLDWLGGHIPSPRWLKATEAAWTLADWP